MIKLNEFKRKIMQVINKHFFIILFLVMAAQIAGGLVFASTSAELIIYNAKITTQNAGQPVAEAVAVADGKVMAVGSSVEVLQTKSDSTLVINANERRVIPGLVDSHSHFLRSGLTYTRELRWDGVPTLKQGLEMIKQVAEITPRGEWVRVIGGWTPWQFEERRLPTSEELTEAAPHTPVYVQPVVH